MQYRKFNVVTDGQFGSCGKGLVTTALAHKYRPQIISTTNMANAGHTAVNDDGQKFIAKALPSASILTKWCRGYQPHIVVGASAAFNIDQLNDEVQTCGLNYSLSIHPRAGVITDAHKQAEAGDGESSTKHIASTMQGCGAFAADKILRKKDLLLARDYPELSGYMAQHLPNKLNISSHYASKYSTRSLPEVLDSLMRYHDVTILHEGSQGFSLDINHGHSYPQCTSRGTTAIQNMADMGISPRMLGDVYLVIRPFPIRVGNVIENGQQVGYSGDCYEDQTEITWEQVAKEAAMPEDVAASLLKTELTTVTKRLRRVYTFSARQLREAAIVNGATKIVLNFANYIDYACNNTNEQNRITPKIHKFIENVEEITKIPVVAVGTGPQTNHVIWL